MPEPFSTLIFRRLPAGLARRNLKVFATRLEEHVTGGRRFTCLLADDAELQRLNRQFLGRDYPTDVLSFPTSHQSSAVSRRPAAGIDERQATSDEPSSHQPSAVSHRPAAISRRPAAGIDRRRATSDERRAAAPDPAAPDGFLGEIAISADRAAEQARERGHSLEHEVEILLLHGVLHLMGMDHDKDRGRMARAERRHRQELGLPEGLIERVRP
jgi:rRNA maturation RNase YbeY